MDSWFYQWATKKFGKSVNQTRRYLQYQSGGGSKSFKNLEDSNREHRFVIFCQPKGTGSRLSPSVLPATRLSDGGSGLSRGTIIAHLRVQFLRSVYSASAPTLHLNALRCAATHATESRARAHKPSSRR